MSRPIDSSVTAVLSQIRSYHDQIAPGRTLSDSHHGDAPSSQAIPATDVPGFTQTLRGALLDVNRSQQQAAALANAFERGEPQAGLAQVMVAAQQSQLAFRATVETRNRLVQAYQDVMNMPV